MYNKKKRLLYQHILSFSFFLSTQPTPIFSTFQNIESISYTKTPCVNENGRIRNSKPLLSFNGNDSGRKVKSMGKSINNELSLSQIEEEVIASANEKLDIKRVKNALRLDIEDPSNQAREDKVRTTRPSHLSVAFASGSVIAATSLLAFHSPIVSVLLFLITTYVASRDPTIENDGIVEGDEISGPIARIVGRATIKSIEQTKPKVQAVARAVLSGEEEVNSLRRRIKELEVENEQLQIWCDRRKAIDEKSKLYTLDALKDMARIDGLPVGGNKVQLMMRLLEEGSLKL